MEVPKIKTKKHRLHHRKHLRSQVQGLVLHWIFVKKCSFSECKICTYLHQKKKNDDPLAALGIDPSLLEDPLDDDDALNDADMDVDVDAIMNEINAPKKQPAKGSKGSSAANTAKTSKQAQPDMSMNLTIDINALPKEDEEPEVELTDEDMKDPSLLSQLLELGVEGLDQDPELAALMNPGSAPPPEDEDEFELDAEDLQDPSLLKEFKNIGGSWTDPKTKKSNSLEVLL